MKKILLTATLGLFTTYTDAQTLQEIVSKTDNERFDLAAADLRALMAKEPNKGEYYYYYGENSYKRGETDSAFIYYTKGSEVNPTYPLNFVGLGKCLLLKSNEAEAKTQFYKAASLGGGKNAELLRRTAEAWLVTDIKNPDEAINLANAAIKIEPKNPENYILLGDAQLEKNPSEGSTPIKSYNTATTLNPKSVKGVLRVGKLYQRGRNYQLALDKYKEALAIDVTFAPAFREIAELYFLAGQPSKSIENWKKYLELNDSPYARYRFMSAFYSNKQYTEAVTEYESLKKTGFVNLYFERLAAYSYYEMGNKTDTAAYKKGFIAIEQFFKMAGPKFNYIGTDYKYRGFLLLRLGKDSLASIDLEKAIALEPALRNDVYSEMAASAMRTKNYTKAITNFEAKMNGDAKNLNSNDFFSLGKAYFYTGIAQKKEINDMKDALIKKKKPTNTPEITTKESDLVQKFVKADSSFSKVTQLNITWPIGYFWRARANSYLDPENTLWLAKPHYEKMVSLITKPEERNTTYKTNLIEAYEYLGSYYVTTKDKTKADETWTLVKELDPNNEKAKNYFAPPKPVKPSGTGEKTKAK